MNYVPRPLYLLGKAVYYSLFDRIAGVRLTRPPAIALLRDRQNSPSIKIVSYYGWHNGISQGAQLQNAAFKALGYASELVDVTSAMRNPFVKIECPRSDLFVLHCAGEHFLRVAWPLRGVLRHGKVVAYFAWEFAEPPRDWPRARNLWDEIWTPSEFSARALAQWSDCPIKVVPHVLMRHSAMPRKWRKGQEPLAFLTMADARSSLSRKNPRGAVKAFQLAFPRERDVELVVKLQGTEARSSPELEKLLEEIKPDTRIRLVKKMLTQEEMNQLFSRSHVLVSLHRGEGFGLPLLEAQTCGLATIATAWSGNLDFTTPENSALIPYTLTTMRDEGEVYGQVTWAEPDLRAAATAMRRFYDDPSDLAHVAAAGWGASLPNRQLERLKNIVAREI
jgi:glycosyltransferase involved in cell wall biosynthesis